MTGPAQAGCAYCGRTMWLAGLEPCCDKPGHAGRLVCADIRGCVDVVLTRLHDNLMVSSAHSAPGEVPVSGRSRPRPAPLPDGFAHDVRFYGSPAGGVSARCRPCRWSVALEDGHDAADFTELERQHCGLPAASPDENSALAVLDSFRRWANGETMPGDWQTWAVQLGYALSGLLHEQDGGAQ